MSRWWKNIGTPESLLRTSHLILGLFEPTVEGEVQGEVVGEVIVDEEAIVGGKILWISIHGCGHRCRKKSHHRTLCVT